MDLLNSLSKDATIVVYTDGACSGNPGPGGWGVVVRANGKTYEWNGGDLQTTNNRMELTACIQALKAIPKDLTLTLRTDSRYVMDGIRHWITGWKRNGWKTANKTAVKNVDLWQELDAIACNRSITWEWIAAHNGEEGNERADQLAKQGIVAARING
jgi:ribonuclease HI